MTIHGLSRDAKLLYLRRLNYQKPGVVALVNQMFDYHGLKISWLGHDSFRIKNGKTIIIDPFKLRSTSDKADILLISHEHFDHLSLDDIKKVVTENTTIVTIPSVKKELGSLKVKEVKATKPGDKLKIGDISIDLVTAYNQNNFREHGKDF